jgi:hypothetical protein
MNEYSVRGVRLGFVGNRTVVVVVDKRKAKAKACTNACAVVSYTRGDTTTFQVIVNHILSSLTVTPPNLLPLLEY